MTTSGGPRDARTGSVVPALHVSALSKTFGRARALADVHVSVAPGQVHALVGENGSGKSTLIKILSGYHDPDPGSQIEIGGEPLPLGSPLDSYRLGCRFVHQDLALVDTLSVADNLSVETGYPCWLGTIRSRALRANVRRALGRVHLDVDPDQLVGELSPAERTGVALARALREDVHSEPVLLVLDEPTASLPGQQVGDLHRMVRVAAAGGVGVLYVSHHLREVFELADVVTVLRDGVIVATTPTSEIDHAGLVHLIVGTDVVATPPIRRTRSGPPILVVENLARGELTDLSFEGRPGEIIGVAGITGSGRESVLPAVFGAVPRDGGSVSVGGVTLRSGSPRQAIGSGVTYLPPDRRVSGGVMNLSARENFSLSNLLPFWRFPFVRRGAERAEAAQWFDRLDVRPAAAADRPLETLSGGNQQKVLLAKWLRLKPSVLLLDDPTQGVDIAAKALLHRQIAAAAEAGACVVVSSSDNEELAGLCDRVIVLVHGRASEELADHELTTAALTRLALGRQRLATS